MAKSSGGGRLGAKTGSWIDFRDGKDRVGVIFSGKEKIGGKTVYAAGYNVRHGSRSYRGRVFYEPKTGEVFNSRYDVERGTPSVHGDTWRIINVGAKK